MAQIFPTDFEEKLTMAQDDYILFSDSEDGNKIKKAQYQNLKGEKGDTGARINSASFSGNDIVFGETDGNSVTLANAKTTLTGPKGEDGADGQDGAAATITVGNTTTGDAGTNASVTNSGTSSAAIFNFTIPKGDKGDTGATGSAATISVGSTTTGDAGTSASVVNSGTSSAAVLDFTIPKGDKGDTGNTGATGNGIASITSSKSGKVTTVTITETNGNSDSFTVEDGADGQGSGDMNASTYDPTGKMADAFDYDNMHNTPTIPSTAADVGALPDTTKYGANLSFTINSSTYVVTAQLKDQNGNNLGTAQTIDLPLESVVVSGSYDSATKKVVLTLQNGNTIEFSVADLVSGLQSEITSSNKLDADLVDDSTSTNKFVTATDKSTWSGKQDALTLPATPTQGNLVVRGANNKTIADGGVIPTGVPSGGNNGDVLTNVSGTPTWTAPSGGDVMVSSQSGNILTSGMKIWAGTEADYGNLGTYDSNTVYLTI